MSLDPSQLDVPIAISTVFWFFGTIGVVRIIDRRYSFSEKWTMRFLVFAGAAVFQRVIWFLTMQTQSDFPTGEVQYAVVPALLHPYLWPWQAPYGIVWYGIQYGLVAIGFPFWSLLAQLLNIQCPQGCMIPIHYLNGTIVTVPFEAGLSQYLMGLSWMTGLLVMDVPFYWLFRKSVLLVSYLISSLWFFATTPVNQSILWLLMLGWVNPLFLVLGPLAKLPVGSELVRGDFDVWTFGIGSASTIGHMFPYGMLGVWWGAAMLHWIDKRAHNGNPTWVPWLSRNWRAVRDYE